LRTCCSGGGRRIPEERVELKVLHLTRGCTNLATFWLGTWGGVRDQGNGCIIRLLEKQ